MDEEFIEGLLARGETVNVEFKGEIDLKSKYGKAKFIKEILALANSPISPGYLFIGVDDDGIPVGFDGVTEEQIQQIIADNCKPSIFFSFEEIEIDDVAVGVINIPHSARKPHTTNAKLGFQEQSGKNGEITDKQIFIRRGKIINEATRDEIVEMAQDVDTTIEQLEKMNNNLERLNHIRNDLSGISHSIDWLGGNLEPIDNTDIFVDTVIGGTIAGAGVGLLSGLGWVNNFWAILIICFVILLMLTAIKINKFSFTRIVITTFVLGIIINGMSDSILLTEKISQFLKASFGGSIIFQTTLKNLLFGAISGWLIARAESLFFWIGRIGK